MHFHHIKGMSNLLAQELQLDPEQIKLILSSYWEDRVAFTWGIDDVLGLAPQIGEEKAREVLWEVFDRIDCGVGLSWDNFYAELVNENIPEISTWKKVLLRKEGGLYFLYALTDYKRPMECLKHNKFFNFSEEYPYYVLGSGRSKEEALANFKKWEVKVEVEEQ